MNTNTKKLMTSINFNNYTNRMDQVSDKENIIDYVPKDAKTILDVGCGTGVLAKHFNKEKYIGYDLENNMVEYAKNQNPGYKFTNNLDEINNIDCIILSSVLHEVYSYNNNSYEAVKTFLKEINQLLSKNGIIIIRDGILTINNNYQLKVKLVDEKDAIEFLEKLKTGPQDFSEIKIKNGYLIADQENIIHFLNVYTWGWESVTREMNERVNFATYKTWKDLINDAGFALDTEHLISQESYFEHLNKIIDTTTLPTKWHTKVIIKARKL